MQGLKKYLAVFRGEHFQLTMDLLLALGLPLSRPISLKTRISAPTIDYYMYWLNYRKTQNHMQLFRPLRRPATCQDHSTVNALIKNQILNPTGTAGDGRVSRSHICFLDISWLPDQKVLFR